MRSQRMVLHAVSTISVSRIEELEAEALAATLQASSTLSRSKGASLKAAAENESRDDERLFAPLAATLASAHHPPPKGPGVSSFFAAGSIEGPFPGARSAQGEFMASQFFSHARPLAGLMPSQPKTSRYSSSGYKLRR